MFKNKKIQIQVFATITTLLIAMLGLVFFPFKSKGPDKEYLKECTLDQYLTEVHPYPIYVSPGYEIIEDMQEQDQTSLLLFSYDVPSSKDKAVAFGIKRVFDRAQNEEDLPPAQHEDARGLVNVRYTFDFKNRVNGTLQSVPIQEVSNLIHDHPGLDLIPIVVMDYKDYKSHCHNPTFKIAYTFRAPQQTSLTNKTLLPRPVHYEKVRESQKALGKDYYQMWMDTTYYADGKTPIEHWENAVHKKESFTQPSENLS